MTQSGIIFLDDDGYDDENEDADDDNEDADGGASITFILLLLNLGELRHEIVGLAIQILV